MLDALFGLLGGMFLLIAIGCFGGLLTLGVVAAVRRLRKRGKVNPHLVSQYMQNLAREAARQERVRRNVNRELRRQVKRAKDKKLRLKKRKRKIAEANRRANRGK